MDEATTREEATLEVLLVTTSLYNEPANNSETRFAFMEAPRGCAHEITDRCADLAR
jgi:hypothetical protein